MHHAGCHGEQRFALTIRQGPNPKRAGSASSSSARRRFLTKNNWPAILCKAHGLKVEGSIGFDVGGYLHVVSHLAEAASVKRLAFELRNEEKARTLL